MRRGALAAAALILLALLAATWTLSRPDAPPRAPAAAAGAIPAVAAATPAQKPARKTSAAPDAAGDADASAVPSPVNLDAVDRDRDLHGVVVRRDGAPIGGAEVVAVLRPWSRANTLNISESSRPIDGPRTRTASDGTFALRLRRGTRAGLRVRADGFAQVELDERLAGERVRVVLDPGVRMRVSVVDETNRVVAGVRLGLGRRWAATRPAETDASGQAVFEGLPPSSRFSVELLSTGWGDVGIREFQTGEGAESEERLVLVKGRTLRGRVVDEATDAPVAKARVGMNWTLEHAVETDADGRYELPGWVGKNVQEIELVAEGCARESVEVGAKEEIDFRLHRGFEATGRVVDEAGRPVAGALVEVIASTFADHRQRTSFGDATTDAAGRFRVTSLDPRMPHVVVAMADGFGRVRKPLPAPGEPKAADVGDVVLAPGRLLAGRFVDAEDKPMTRRWIVLDGPKSDWVETAASDYGAEEDVHTDDLGRFAFADLPPGDYVVRTEWDGSLQCETKATLPADRDLLDVVLRLPPASGVEVRVVDENGAPIADADVDAMPDGDGEPVSAHTDAQGVARLHIPWDAGEIQAGQPYGTTRRFLGCDEQAWKKGDAGPLKFVLREGAAVEGVVVDPQGKGVPTAGLLVAEGYGEERRRTTDASGRFDLVFEKGAKVRLVFEGASEGKETGLSGAVDCSAPQTGVVLTCSRIDVDRTLAVKATTPDGAPVVGTTIEVTGYGWNESRTATTDARGVARFEALPARALRVWAHGTDTWARSATVEATPAGQEAAVVLRRGVAVHGVVVNAEGKPAAADVHVWRGGEDAGRVATDAQGRFSLLVPADGEGEIYVSARGPEGHGDVEDAAADAEVRVTLAK